MKLILSAICIALLALFAYQVMSYPLDADNSQNVKLDKGLANSLDYNLPQLAVLNSLDQYSEIVQRPLFAKDRAAAISAQVVNKVTTVDELSHLILVGTASSSDVQIAIVADTKAKQMERLKVGESYEEWNIAEVSSDHVVFQNEELEYKLFVTPIKGSQKDKQAKLIGQLNKSKIERAAAAIRSNQKVAGSADKIQDKPKRSITERSWGYNKKFNQANIPSSDTKNSTAGSQNKPAKRSPIKIPGEEEKDAAFYEGLGDEKGDASGSGNSEKPVREITAEDFYNDEAISEDELKLLEELGVKIFDD